MARNFYVMAPEQGGWAAESCPIPQAPSAPPRPSRQLTLPISIGSAPDRSPKALMVAGGLVATGILIALSVCLPVQRSEAERVVVGVNGKAIQSDRESKRDGTRLEAGVPLHVLVPHDYGAKLTRKSEVVHYATDQDSIELASIPTSDTPGPPTGTRLGHSISGTNGTAILNIEAAMDGGRVQTVRVCVDVTGLSGDQILRVSGELEKKISLSGRVSDLKAALMAYQREPSNAFIGRIQMTYVELATPVNGVGFYGSGNSTCVYQGMVTIVSDLYSNMVSNAVHAGPAGSKILNISSLLYDDGGSFIGAASFKYNDGKFKRFVTGEALVSDKFGETIATNGEKVMMFGRNAVLGIGASRDLKITLMVDAGHPMATSIESAPGVKASVDESIVLGLSPTGNLTLGVPDAADGGRSSTNSTYFMFGRTGADGQKEYGIRASDVEVRNGALFVNTGTLFVNRDCTCLAENSAKH